MSAEENDHGFGCIGKVGDWACPHCGCTKFTRSGNTSYDTDVEWDGHRWQEIDSTRRSGAEDGWDTDYATCGYCGEDVEEPLTLSDHDIAKFTREEDDATTRDQNQ